MGETQLRGNIIQGDGVYKTTDGGKTWTHVGLEKTQAIAPHPRPSRPIPTSSTSRRSAIRTARTPERGVFKSTDGGKTWDARAVPRRQDRRGRSRRWIRRTRTCSTPALWEVFRTPHSLSSGGPGSGLFKTTDGGSDLDRADEEPRAAETALGQDRRRGLGRRLAIALYAIIEAPGRRRVPVRRRGRDVEAGQRRPQHPPARLLLHAHLRRSAGEGHGLRPQRRRSTARPTPARRCAASACRTATTTICGSRRTIRSGMINSQRRRRQRVAQRRRELDRPGLSDRAVLQRLHDRARAVPRLRRAAGQQHGVRAEHRRRRALRRRRRRERLHRARSATTPTSSTPAATAAC